MVCTFDVRQDDMRDKFFTYADRVDIYANGKRAFEEGRLRSSNPYATSQDFGGLWWHGWDMAREKRKGERSVIVQSAL